MPEASIPDGAPFERAGGDVSEGGGIDEAVAFTVKEINGTLVPSGAVTVNVLAPVVAPAVMVMLSVTYDPRSAVITPVTPVPLKATAVAPDRLLP